MFILLNYSIYKDHVSISWCIYTDHKIQTDFVKVVKYDYRISGTIIEKINF